MARGCRVLEPLRCEITQDYKAGVHNGIDIVGPGYTLCWEIAHSDGTVVAIRNNCNGFEQGSYGNYVKIRHDNGYYTLYAHGAYNTVQVSVGQRVKRGQRLMYMGNTGYSFGGHLHWEVRTPNDTKIDPTPYLDADLPSSSPAKEVNVYYRVKTQRHGWLPEVKNLEDYAGWEKSPIIDFMVRVDKGSVWYQAHIKGGNWLSRVTGYDMNDYYNGYAGDDRNPIDCVRIYYNTPADIRPFKKAKYRINNYPWVYDNEKCPNGDDFAGEYGVTATELRVTIE